MNLPVMVTVYLQRNYFSLKFYHTFDDVLDFSSLFYLLKYSVDKNEFGCYGNCEAIFICKAISFH